MHFRQIHLDFHTSPLIPGVGAAFDKKEWQATLKAAHVDSVTLFAYGHHGNAYFDTEIGHRHPGLSFNLLRAQMDACHEIGVATPVYISAGLNEWVAAEHPEWLEHRPGQKPISEWGAGFKKLCFNTAYMDLLCKMTVEVVQKFPDADGIFFDIVTQGECDCADCRAGMKKLGLDPDLLESRQKWQHQVQMEYYRRSTEAVHSVDPKMRVFHNAGNVAVGSEEILKYFSHLELESLPTGGWGYDHFPMSAAFVRNLHMDFLGMTGKFDTTWGEFGGFKHPNALRYECAAMIANGAKCSIGDQLHPSGKLDYSTYREVIAPAYAEVEAKEAWCDGVHSLARLAILPKNAYGQLGKPYWYEPKTGASRILLESHIPFDIVDEHLNWDAYDFLLLPDDVRLNDTLVKRLAEFRKRGGKPILSAESGIREDNGKFIEDLGFTDAGESEWLPDYLLADKAVTPDYVHTPFVMYQAARHIHAAPGAYSLGQIYAPYFNRTREHFCSHAQTPYQPTPAGFDAGVMTDSVLYFAHPVFVLYRKIGAVNLQQFLEKALKKFIGAANQIETSGLPTTGRVTWMRQDAEHRDVLHVLYANTIMRGQAPSAEDSFITSHGAEIIEELLPIGPVKVSVLRAAAPSAVKLAPSGKALKFQYVAGRVEFTVPRFTCHQMVELDD